MRVTFASLALVFFGCGDDGGKAPDAPKAADAKPIDAPVETLGAAPDLAMACADPIADVYTLPGGLPTMSDAHRGDIFRCATTESLSAYKVNKQIDAYNVNYPLGVAGKATGGFWTHRLAYRTQRNTVAAARAEGDTAATLMIPEHPLAGAPLVVFGHGSVGIAPKCAPSKLDLSADAQDEDYPPILLRLASAGFTVIAPDYSGFSYGQVPGYFNAEDEAHAVLDATRAAAKILKNPPPKVVFVGHSQGGHAVIAAQSYKTAYGMTGELVGVATMAPFWVSLTLFPAATTPAAGLTTANDVSSILYAMEYAYSAAELREGPGAGLQIFATAKQAAAKATILDGECYDTAKLTALGATPNEFFETNYVNNVGSSCALQGTCTDNLSTKWKPYWVEDRPAIDANGAPLLVMLGGMDTFINTGRGKCMQSRFTADIASGTATVKYCYNSASAHRDFPRSADADYVIAWIAARAGAGAEPADCPAFTTALPCPAVPQNY